MENFLQELRPVLGRTACAEYTGEENVSELIEKMKTPWGVEYVKNTHFPGPVLFRKYADELAPLGVVCDAPGAQFYNRDVVLVGGSAIIEFSHPARTYTVLLMGGCKCVVKARACAVVRVYDITGDNELETDATEESVIYKN